MPRRLHASAALVLLAAGCQIHDGENPVVTIVSPADGAVNDSSSLEVVIDVDRFTLDPEVFPPDDESHSQAFHGHWHLYIRALADDEYYFIDDQFTTSALITNIPPGMHEIAVELVNQNHTRIYGTDIEFATFEVPSSAPRVALVEPDHGDTVNSSSADLVLATENVSLVAPGGTNADGEGHFHVQIDGRDVLETFATALTVTDLVLTTGGIAAAPVIDVELVQNDHTPFPTRVQERVTVSVPASAPRVFINAPIEAATVGTAFTVSFERGNFQIVDYTLVTQEVVGQGHYHVLVDGADVGHGFAGAGSSDPVTAPIVVTPGAHEVRFELRSNLHDPLVPPVVDIVHVTATN